VKSKSIFRILLVLLLSSCTSRFNQQPVPTATAVPVTSTVPVTPSAFATDAPPLPPPAQPTVAPVEGTTSTQINVRADPSTASQVLGIIPASTKVQILGKDLGGSWLQILYPPGVDGKAWVTAQYVVTASGIEIPVLGRGTNPTNGNTAIVGQQINVRSGPGTGFNSLGILNAQDVVHLTGKDASGGWLQIEYPSGPDGKGWVNAAFVQAKGVENVPIITEAGEVLGTGTPTSIPATPTVTVMPAWDDGDSQSHPIASVVFQPLGTHTLIYSGDTSAPSGDSQDWIQFTPYSKNVFASLECFGKNALLVNLLESGQPSTLQLACGDTKKELVVKADSIYVIHLQAPQFSGGVQYFPYTITIEAGL
jgi:uncharacterized protein YraI